MGKVVLPMDEPFAYQTRSEKTGFAYHDSIGEAIEFARRDPSVWKISFTSALGDSIRLVKVNRVWAYCPIEKGEPT